MDRSVRTKGILKFVAFGSAAVAIGVAVYSLAQRWGHAPPREFLIFLAVPGAYALVGLIEAISGSPFQEFSKRWDQLAGWQRGVVGLAVVIFAFAILVTCMVAFVQGT